MLPPLGIQRKPPQAKPVLRENVNFPIKKRCMLNVDKVIND